MAALFAAASKAYFDRLRDPLCQLLSLSLSLLSFSLSEIKCSRATTYCVSRPTGHHEDPSQLYTSALYSTPNYIYIYITARIYYIYIFIHFFKSPQRHYSLALYHKHNHEHWRIPELELGYPAEMQRTVSKHESTSDNFFTLVKTANIRLNRY